MSSLVSEIAVGPPHHPARVFILSQSMSKQLGNIRSNLGVGWNSTRLASGQKPPNLGPPAFCHVPHTNGKQLASSFRVCDKDPNGLSSPQPAGVTERTTSP